MDFRTQLCRSLNSAVKDAIQNHPKRQMSPEKTAENSENETNAKNRNSECDKSSLSDGNSENEDSNFESRDSNFDNVPSSPNVDVVRYSPEEILSRKVDIDLESDIDVCSGEDDEVLELDFKDCKQEVTEISSTSDSDVEVCDYEPSGKRMKSYNTLPPAIQF